MEVPNILRANLTPGRGIQESCGRTCCRTRGPVCNHSLEPTVPAPSANRHPIDLVIRTKVIAALLAVLTALGGLNLFQSIKQKLQPNDEAVVEVVTVSETDGITVREEGNRIVIRTSAVSSSEADAGTEEVMISERFTVKEGATLRVDVSHAEFQIVTGSGNEASVEVTLDSSRMWVKSSHGDIAGKALRASVIELETSHADLEFESIESEEFNARTSHADIDIDRLRGAATLRTSHGDVDVELIDELGADIETQHGDVSVRVTKDARFDLDLQGAEVEVSSALRVNGRVSEDRVDGSINGGGQVLRVRTTHGEVVVR